MWIELPQISPAARTSACSVCGCNVTEVPAFSTGVDILYEGIIEVCQRCIVQAANMLGMVTAEKYAETVAGLAELQEWADNAYTELNDRQSTIETIAAALSNTAAERDEWRVAAGAGTPA